VAKILGAPSPFKTAFDKLMRTIVTHVTAHKTRARVLDQLESMKSAFQQLIGKIDLIGKSKVEERRKCADEWKKQAGTSDSGIVKDLYDHYSYKLECLVNGDPKKELEQKDEALKELETENLKL
jgi:hypothetical protein